MLVELTIKQKRYITIFNIIIPFLVGSAVDLYVPSLPHIATSFQVAKNLAQLTIGLYMLGYGVGQFFLGVLSDYLGRRKIFMTSTVFFTIVSFVAAIAPNIYVLNLCRFFQGLGIAGISVSRRALMVDCFSGMELVKAMTLISTSWAIGPIVGPYIGGYLQHYFSWRADFYFFSLYGLFVFFAMVMTLPETNLNKQILNVKAMANSIRTIFVESAFMFVVVLLSLMYSMLVIFNTIAPFLIQNVLKYSVVAYGHIALFMGFGYFIGTLSNRQLIRYFDPLRVAMLGLFCALSSILVMLILALLVSLSLYVVIIPVFITFLFCGLVFPNLMARIMELFPKMAGTASAVFGIVVAGGVFLMALFATTLKTTSQIPMAITYLIMMIVCLLLFFTSKNRLKEV